MAEHDELNRHLKDARSRRRSRVLEGAESILRSRTRVLADRVLEETVPDVFAEVVTVRRDKLFFAFPITEAREVRRVETTGFPGSTATINGVFQIRGRVLSLVDLAPFAADATTLDHGEQTLVIVVGDRDRAMGIRIDEVVGPRTILRNEIDDEFQRTALPFVRNVTRDLVHVVDVAALQDTPEIQLSQRRK